MVRTKCRFIFRNALRKSVISYISHNIRRAHCVSGYFRILFII